MKKSSVLTLLLAFSVGLLSISLGSCLNDDLPADRMLSHPLRSLEFHSEDEIFVSAAESVPLASLVNLSAFEGLRPGTTASEAQAMLGRPQRVFQQYRGHNTVYVFPGTGGAIELLKQKVDSEGFEGIRWFLRWRPVDRNPKTHLRPEILAALPDLRTIASLGIESDDGKASLELEDGLVSSILWLRQGPIKMESIL